jgi:glucosamine-6-phosphate deaminase
MGVSTYFTEMKMRYAAEQLREGKRVGEIAAELGYYDQNYFSTAFRRMMGVSPGSFRPNERKVATINTNLKNNNTKENHQMKFITVDSYEKLSHQAANILAAQITMKPKSVLGLATGSSPVGIYRDLIERYNNGDLDFSEITSVNLDEYVGLDGSNDQSYRYFMQKHLFDHVNIRPECTFVPNGIAEDLDKECAEYDARIKALGGIDLQVLGIGLDGHIGFNEPGDTFVNETHVIDLHESTIRANARFFANENEVPKQAVTMGMASIMQAKKIVLIANGKAKKDVMQKAFYGPITPQLPASILQLHPDLTVIYTEADA